MKFYHLFFAILFSAVMLFAQDAVRFVPEVYPIGIVEQGSKMHIVLKGANITNNDILLENVISQGLGASNFKYPQKISAKSAFTVEFDMDFSYMEGQINPVIILVGNDGKPYTAALDGIVNAPIFLSEKMFDTGYYTKGEKRSWTFYVWQNDLKERPDLYLDEASAKEFSIETKAVKVNIDKLDAIKEGGKVPALKVTLKTNGLSREGAELKQKSLRKIVSFKSKKFPNATPEALIIGYWK